MKDLAVIALWGISLVLFVFIRVLVSTDRRLRCERPDYESELPDTYL